MDLCYFYSGFLDASKKNEVFAEKMRFFFDNINSKILNCVEKFNFDVNFYKIQLFQYNINYSGGGFSFHIFDKNEASPQRFDHKSQEKNDGFS